jgi:aminoglycoside 3-N-acetyltransferase
MLRESLERVLTPKQRIHIRKRLRSAEKSLADLLFRHGPEELQAGLSRLGVRPGDTLLVHSAFRWATGFRGSPLDVVACLITAVGEEGNLLMVSLPYDTSSYKHLLGDPLFDVKRTASKMGIISEIFRRRGGVRRSLHPTHPVLALGKDADWLVRDHERCSTPCGAGTPFAKLRELGGKVLFLDVPFGNFTFIHHIEDLLEGSLPFAVYRAEPLPGRVLDQDGRERIVPTRVFSDRAVATRRPEVLERRLREEGLLLDTRVGRTKLMLVGCEDAVRVATEMADRGVFFSRAEDPRR